MAERERAARIVASKIGDELWVGATIEGRGFWTFRKKDYPELSLLHDALAMLAKAEPQTLSPQAQTKENS